MLPPVTGSPREGASATAPCCSSFCAAIGMPVAAKGASGFALPAMVLKFRPPFWRRTYGFAVAAACLEYSLYSE